MIIQDLGKPVTAAKADWVKASNWLGFTPTQDGIQARAQCQSTIQRQMADGLVVEYITETAEKPNQGFATDPRFLEEQAQHKLNKGKLLAVHQLRHTSRSLHQIIGQDEYSRLQDMWAQGNKRWRWSVAFPIIQSFEIIDHPKAVDVFGVSSYRRLFAHSSATLRPLHTQEGALLEPLEIRELPAPNAWIALEDEMAAVLASEITNRSQTLINQDLNYSALEGSLKEQKVRIKKRAAWLADRFVQERRRTLTLHCDLCDFDPTSKLNSAILTARSALDVHHKYPLAEGVRYTSTNDFVLLCPTCHRMEHLLLRKGGSFFDKAKTPDLFADSFFDMAK